MARKTTTTAAKTKAASEPDEVNTPADQVSGAKLPATDATSGSAPSSDEGKNTQGVEEAAMTAQSAAEAPAGTETGQAPVGEEPQSAPADTATTGDGEDDATADIAASDPQTITVICHRPDGRRRGDRRWPHGPTSVPVGALTDFQLAQLEADPHFTVKHPDD